MTTVRILRKTETMGRLGRCNSSLYEDIDSGDMTKGVKISERAVGWPEHEVDAIVRAKIAGWPKAEIRALVGRLHADRVKLADGLRDHAVHAERQGAA